MLRLFHVLLFLTSASAGVLQVPPYPDDLDLGKVERLYQSARYRVEVRQAGDGHYQRAYVFETRNDWVLYDYWGSDPKLVRRTADQYGEGKSDMRTASFAQFSFANTAVDVMVTLLDDTLADSVTIRPLRHSIPATIGPDRKTIRFRLARPMKLSFEVNDRLNPLFLFCDSPDVPDSAATHYFGPGIHRIPGNGTLLLQSGERVYIAAGAIVEGRFVLKKGSEDIVIRGRGILSGGEWDHPPSTGPDADRNLEALCPVWSEGTRHFELEGLTIVQSPSWQVAIQSHMTDKTTGENLYHNLKLVAWAGNSDAFWVTGDNNRVRDCFVFNNDDLIVTKGGSGTVISDIVAWSGVWGRMTLLFPIEKSTPHIRNLTVKNIDLIGKEGGATLILAQGWSEGRSVSNVVFRDIRVEERLRPANTNNPVASPTLIELEATRPPGPVTGLLLENVSLDQLLPDEGFLRGTEKNPYSDIAFKNVTAAGKPLLSAEDAHLEINDHVSNVRWLKKD